MRRFRLGRRPLQCRPTPMPQPAPDPLEDLLADALAAFDDGGEPALAAFVAANPAHRAALERGLQRCRQMGLLGGAPAAREFPDHLGEFRLLRRLGSGGMGVVYEAEQTSLQRRVALKVVRPELLYFEGARERFRREIEAVARLQHPAIVPVLASGEQDGLAWYAVELLDGHSAHEICLALQDRDPATLTGADLRRVLGSASETGTDPLAGAWWQVATRVVHAVALGVRHAHVRGIVHRDIKPGNIVLTTDGRPVLLDFGIAMVAGGREFTRTGSTPGSPAFMSPEQLRGDAVDERTDVYSLGATLWQLLALSPPFAGVDDLERIRNGDVPSLRAKNRDVPPELVLVVETAMDRDRERRYPDVQAFADDLQAVLHRRPIRARRLGLALRLTRWCQRHRVAATALAAAAIVVVLSPFVFAWRERAVNRELAAAVRNADESLEQSLDAIYGLLVRVGEDRLRFVPAAERMAVESLADAARMYRKLLPRHPDHLRMHVEAGKAMSRFADAQLRLGRADDAIATLREAIGWLSRDGQVVHASWRNARSILWLNLGSALRSTGAIDDAVASFAAAARDIDSIASDPVFAVHVERSRLQLLVEHADLAAGRYPARELELRQDAVRFARELAQRHADDVLRPHVLVVQLDGLATALVQAQRYDDALPLAEEALALARALPADAQVWPTPPLLVADVLETLGTLHVHRRDQRAVPALKECLALREAGLAAFPANVQIRSDVAAALHNLAWMNFHQELYDAAVERLDRAIELQRQVLAEMPNFDQALDYLRNHLTVRGRCLDRLGRRGELEANAERVAELPGPMSQRVAATQWLMVVRALDRSEPPPRPDDAHRRTCLDRAMACLVAAEQLGWGRGNRLDQALYDPLRGRPEFDALLARLAADAGRPAASR